MRRYKTESHRTGFGRGCRIHRAVRAPSLHQLSSVTYAAGADVCEVSLDFAFAARLTQIGCAAPDDM